MEDQGAPELARVNSDEWAMEPAPNQETHVVTKADYEQTIQSDMEPWKTIKSGKLEHVQKMFGYDPEQKQQENVQESAEDKEQRRQREAAYFERRCLRRGPVGETPLHYAVLLQRKDVVLWMMQRCKDLKKTNLLRSIYDKGDIEQRNKARERRRQSTVKYRVINAIRQVLLWLGLTLCVRPSDSLDDDETKAFEALRRNSGFNHGGTRRSKHVLAAVDRACSSSPYHGENLLHLAIINEDNEVFDWLLKESGQAKALMSQPAQGAFFRRDIALCYYGEYALSFAVCANREDMVRKLVDAGADLRAQDSWGNTALHIAVIRNRAEMYDLLLELDKKLDDDPAPERVKSPPLWRHRSDSRPALQRSPLERIRNKDGFTPFLLAARLGSQDIFTKILHKRQHPQWDFGEVYSVIYPLHEVDHVDSHASPVRQLPHNNNSPNQANDDDLRIDVDIPIPPANIKPEAAPHKQSALSIIVYYGHVALLKDGVITELLQQKWAKFGKKEFLTRGYTALAYFLIFAVTIMLHPFKNHHNTFVVATLLEVIVLIGALVKFKREVFEMKSWGLRRYMRQKGAGMLENVAGLSFVMCIFLAFILRWAERDYEVVGLSLACICGWPYLLFFCLGFRSTGPFVVMIHRQLKTDLTRFIIIFVVFLMGFSTAAYALLTAHMEPTEEFSFNAFVDVLKKAFSTTLGEFSYEDWETGPFSVLLLLQLIAFIVTAAILLISLLIAMMSDTYEQVKKQAEQEWRLEWARIIFSMESEMAPQWQQDSNDRDSCYGTFQRLLDRLLDALPEAVVQQCVARVRKLTNRGENAQSRHKLVQPEERGKFQYWVEINGQRYIQVVKLRQHWFSTFRTDQAKLLHQQATLEADQDGVIFESASPGADVTFDVSNSEDDDFLTPHQSPTQFDNRATTSGSGDSGSGNEEEVLSNALGAIDNLDEKHSDPPSSSTGVVTFASDANSTSEPAGDTTTTGTAGTATEPPVTRSTTTHSSRANHRRKKRLLDSRRRRSLTLRMRAGRWAVGNRSRRGARTTRDHAADDSKENSAVSPRAPRRQYTSTSLREPLYRTRSHVPRPLIPRPRTPGAPFQRTVTGSSYRSDAAASMRRRSSFIPPRPMNNKRLFRRESMDEIMDPRNVTVLRIDTTPIHTVPSQLLQ